MLCLGLPTTWGFPNCDAENRVIGAVYIYLKSNQSQSWGQHFVAPSWYGNSYRFYVNLDRHKQLLLRGGGNFLFDDIKWYAVLQVRHQLLMMLKLMWIASLATLAFASVPADKCVCLPDQACWPSTNDWSTFNDTVGGKLVVIHPVATPCHDPTFDGGVCQAITEQYTNSSWRSDQIGILIVYLFDGRCAATS